ncbi:unnamed protein product [Rhizophagus irregularis]|nr:unnamed protein product [Rhizophagus irregularis]
MAGYPPPKFHGLAGEDPADYIRDLRQWCEASPNHDPNAGHQHRIRIDGLFESGLLDYAKDWYETEIKGRNWELQNISDNTGLANIGAINGLANNNALRAINANQFRGGALHIRNTVPADNNAIANPLVLGHTVWEEDWSISGGRPTHLAPNAPNANAGGNVIARGMLELEQVRDDLSSKKYEIECMEKGIESSKNIYNQTIDSLFSVRSNLIEANRSLREQLALKKNNEVDRLPPPINNSSQLGPEGTLSTSNPSSQIISVGGAEAVSLPATAPIVTSSLISPMLIYSILTLVLIAIIWFMARKWWNSQKKSNQYSTYGNYINSDHAKRLLARPDFCYFQS